MLQLVRAQQQIIEKVTRGDYFELIKDFEGNMIRIHDKTSDEILQNELQKFFKRKIKQDENALSINQVKTLGLPDEENVKFITRLQEEILNKAAQLTFDTDFINKITKKFSSLFQSDKCKLVNIIINFIMNAGVDSDELQIEIVTTETDKNKTFKNCIKNI